MGGTVPATFNAANEIAVGAFLKGRIPFGRIAEIVERTLAGHRVAPADTLESVIEADTATRQEATALC